MKKEDVKIAGLYTIKIGKNTVAVRIMSPHPHGGWLATAINTGNSMHVTADRLCGRYNPKPEKESAATSEQKPQPAVTPATDTDSKPAKGGGLAAAARVLTEAGMPLRCKDIVKTMLAQGLWKTEGKTPEQTIYSAIIREIKDKGTASRFRKTERGMFTINSQS
jgi:hypothetical protein